VTLLEARRLPRPKTCGGGLTPKAQRLVPSSVLRVVERRVHRVELRGGRLPPVHLDAPAAEIAMVRRSRFDLAMAESAAASGAEIRDGEYVDTLIEDGHGVDVVTQRGQFRVDVVVAADGEPSGMARRLGLGSRAVRHSLALAVDIPLADGQPQDSAILSLTVPGGYAWYFPKGDHANIGAMSSRTTSSGRMTDDVLRQGLSRLADDLGIGIGDRRVAGHWVPQALREGRIASGRVILAGDAAATADPFFGEGISFAISSGIAASQAIADMASGRIADLRPYDARMRDLFKPPHRRLRFTAAVAERSPTLALAALRLSPWVRAYAVDAVSGRRAPFTLE